MAENLIGQFVSGGPYIHSDPIHFRLEVGKMLPPEKDRIKQLEKDLESTRTRLEKMKNSLKNEADTFLADWNGDYAEASRDLFGGNREKNTKEQEYRRVFDRIVNSKEFLSMVQEEKGVGQINEKIANDVLGKYGLDIYNKVLQEKGQVVFGDFVDKVASELTKNQRGGKRVYLTGFEDVMQKLYGETTKQYFQNKETLRKSINKQLKKKTQKIDWNNVYQWVRTQFLSHFPQDERAEQIMDAIEIGFLHEGNKIKGTEYANITGLALEGLEAVMLNHTDSQLSAVFVVGEEDEQGVVDLSKRIVKYYGVAEKQITKMGHKNSQSKQSGTDWILLNKRGKMVRAQAKNSISILEEIRAGSLNRPQSIHLQGEIKYDSFKQNLQNYSKGKGGLTADDWEFLDYLIANTLWIRSGGAVTRGAGKGYASQVSGIMELVSNMLAREMGYFLGVTIDEMDPLGYAETVTTGSNIFYVLDGVLLYPTWKLVETMEQQVMTWERGVAGLSVFLGTKYTVPSREEVRQAKDREKEKSPWQPGDPYGEGLLRVGKDFGNNILGSLTMRSVVMNINIEQMIKEVYESLEMI